MLFTPEITLLMQELEVVKGMLWLRPCTLIDIKRAGVRDPLGAIQRLEKTGYLVPHFEVDVIAVDGTKHFTLMYTFIYEQAQQVELLLA